MSHRGRRGCRERHVTNNHFVFISHDDCHVSRGRSAASSASYVEKKRIPDIEVDDNDHGRDMITCVTPPAEEPAPTITAAAEPGSIGAPVKAAVPERIDAR